MPEMPDKLAHALEALSLVSDRTERIQMLIDIAERFREVPPRLASRPFPPEHQVPACESEAYVWGEPRPDGTLDFHFAVENPQGISARALAVIPTMLLYSWSSRSSLPMVPLLLFSASMSESVERSTPTRRL